MERPKGMHETAFKAYIRACFLAGIDPSGRVMQTIGNAPASAGFHARDGVLDGQSYCAAVDLRTRDLTRKQIKALLKHLAYVGFACWYRFEGSFSNNEHIHAVYAALPMKPQLQRQVIDFLNNRDGLASHAQETFYTAPPATDAIIRAMFIHANGEHRSLRQVA
jgi:hypothetical protein